MGNFSNDRSDRGRRDDRSGFKAPQMHSATCSKCGKSCLVPFRPTGNRPIFCSDCFRTEGGESTPRTNDRGSQNRSDRPMFDAICDKCGNRCQIPFQPRQGKPVFCSHCFEQNERGGNSSENRMQNNNNNNQLDEVNAKLDRILSLLSPKIASNPKVVKKEEEVIVEETFEAPVKKAPVKKRATSKKESQK